MPPSKMDQETADVVICGCGPTGALLSANLSRLGVRNIILEKDAGITTDPRGIALDEDGIRSLQGVGIYESIFTEIGQTMDIFRFIDGGKGLHPTPFLQFHYNTIEGGTGHPGFMCHKQPLMEKHLRAAINPNIAELRSGSTVVAIEEDENSVYVHYESETGEQHVIRAKFLVGADGKTGFVRKKYLEPKGITMEKSVKFHYEAIWVALNWHLILPTPQTHPSFPLWAQGYSPEQVYDLFFPREFNFICNPDRPSVCGRFGRPEDRLWRFEFVVKTDEDGTEMASEKETKKIIMPYLTHPGSRYSLSEDVVWPVDCIECIRSRPFSFSARSCNKWALGRTILCGDAAHVFPPFGGQGIASGFRDAISLSWRLKLATQARFHDYEALFAGWYGERKQQLERSLASTIENGNFCNEPSRVKAFVRNWYLWSVQLVPSWKHNLQLGGRREGMTRYDWAPGMPFLPQYGGGKSFPQVFSAPIDGPAPTIPTFMDDAIFSLDKQDVFQIVALLDSVDQLKDATAEIGRLEILGSLLNPADATYIVHGEIRALLSDELSSVSTPKANIVRVLGAEEYTAAGLSESAEKMIFKRPPPLFYDPNRIRRDLGSDVRFVIVRWDRFVFASCRNGEELRETVAQLEKSVNGRLSYP